MNEIEEIEVEPAELPEDAAPVLMAPIDVAEALACAVDCHHSCGAFLRVGWTGWLGERWTARVIFDRAGMEVRSCPVCDAELAGDALLTLAEVDRAWDKLCLATWGAMMPPPLDAAAVELVNALMERGEDVEGVAAMLHRDEASLVKDVEECLGAFAEPAPDSTILSNEPNP